MQRLAALDEVRAVDVAVAEQEVGAAIADLQRARAELTRASIRSPIDGHVLSITAWPGEEVTTDGLMSVARTARMYVFAEVPESDVGALVVGQRAVVRGESLAAPLEGVVDYLGTVVTKNNTLPVNPVSFSDARIVEVKVRLDDNAVARRLISARSARLHSGALRRLTPCAAFPWHGSSSRERSAAFRRRWPASALP